MRVHDRIEDLAVDTLLLWGQHLVLEFVELLLKLLVFDLPH